jgi:hypothetical protein
MPKLSNKWQDAGVKARKYSGINELNKIYVIDSLNHINSSRNS